MNGIHEYLAGLKDGKAVAAGMSPADVRERLNILGTDSPSPYGRGFRKALDARLGVPGGVRRGQGGTCHGTLTVALYGPQGSGKSMVKKFLECIMPLLPVERFTIEEHVTDD